MSTPAKHTPWRVRRIEYSKGMDVSFEVVGGTNHLIAQTIMREKGQGLRDEIIKDDERHCHLIATAPTMFDALKDAYSVLVKAGLSAEIDLGYIAEVIHKAAPVLEREGE